MSEVAFQPPDLGMSIEHVIDRNGYVWRVVRDGGIATRAHYAGLVSIGIAALEREAGPLLSLAARDAQVRSEALREAADEVGHALSKDSIDQSWRGFAVWLRARAEREEGK